jgi:hypothetical protein
MLNKHLLVIRNIFIVAVQLLGWRQIDSQAGPPGRTSAATHLPQDQDGGAPQPTSIALLFLLSAPTVTAGLYHVPGVGRGGGAEKEATSRPADSI